MVSGVARLWSIRKEVRGRSFSDIIISQRGMVPDISQMIPHI